MRWLLGLLLLLLVVTPVAAIDMTDEQIMTMDELYGEKTITTETSIVEYSIQITNKDYVDAAGHLSVWLYYDEDNQVRDERNFPIDFMKEENYIFNVPAESSMTWFFGCEFSGLAAGKYLMKVEWIDDDLYGFTWARHTSWLTVEESMIEDGDGDGTNLSTLYTTVLGSCCCFTFIAGVGAVVIASIWKRIKRD